MTAYSDGYSQGLRDGVDLARNPELIKFAHWLISLDDDDPDSPGRKDRRTVTLSQIINRAKEALGDAG